MAKSVDARGIIVTAQADRVDCISRCFYPKLDVLEDPVTGSAHCLVIPFWANRLNKKNLVAYLVLIVYLVVVHVKMLY